MNKVIFVIFALVLFSAATLGNQKSSAIPKWVSHWKKDGAKGSVAFRKKPKEKKHADNNDSFVWLSILMP
jgi:hypothetical protein